MKQPNAYRADLNKRNYDYILQVMKERKLHSFSEALNLILDLHRYNELIDTLRKVNNA